jgi:hypothetical protein
MPEKAAGSSPTSSRWALETPMTRARLGSGRRLRGSAAEVAVRSGRRSCSNRRYRCFLTPGPVRRVPKLGKEFTRCSGLERFGTAKQRGTRRLDAGAQRQDYDSLPCNKGGPGGQAAAFLDTEIGRRDPPRAVGTERIRSLRLTLGFTIMSVEDDGRYRPQEQLRREMLRRRIRSIGATAHPRGGPGCLRRVFPQGFPSRGLVIIMSRSSPRQGIGAIPTVGGGVAAAAAAQPRSSPRRRSGRTGS